MSSQLLWLSWRKGCDACKRQVPQGVQQPLQPWVALRNWTPTGSCQVCNHAFG